MQKCMIFGLDVILNIEPDGRDDHLLMYNKHFCIGFIQHFIIMIDKKYIEYFQI